MALKININNDKYDYKKTLLKILRSTAIVFLTGMIVISTDKPEFIMLIPLMEGALNYLKHRK
jgi:hypothetical protein